VSARHTLVLRSRDARFEKARFDPASGSLQTMDDPWKLGDVVDGIYSLKFDEPVVCFCTDGRLVMRVGGSEVPLDDDTAVSLEWNGVGPNHFTAVHPQGTVDVVYRLQEADIVIPDVFFPYEDQEDEDVFVFLHRMMTRADKLALCRSLWCHDELHPTT